jgi:hypothetical protein
MSLMSMYKERSSAMWSERARKDALDYWTDLWNGVGITAMSARRTQILCEVHDQMKQVAVSEEMIVKDYPLGNDPISAATLPLGPSSLRNQKGKRSPPRPKRSKMVAKVPTTYPKKVRAVHGLPFGGTKNIKGSFWVNSKFEITCHDCSGKNKFPGVHISNYCQNAKEVSRQISKRNGAVLAVQYVCQCSTDNEEPSVPAEQPSVPATEQDTFEEVKHDGFTLKWNKTTNDILDPDDGEILGKMVPTINDDSSDESDSDDYGYD